MAFQTVSALDTFQDNSVPTDVEGDSFATDLDIDIEQINWNKAFPYQLLVLRAQGNNSYAPEPGWKFTLPIAPEDYSVQMPFAINGFVSQDGFIEQHNGAPIRMIQFSGSFGVYPLRGQATGRSEGILADLGRTGEAIFGGTIQSVKNATSLAIGAATGAPFTGLNLYQDSEIEKKGTGYYQFRLLNRFLEAYVQRKKKAGNEALRLALVVWKDESAWIVTPQTYEVRRTASSPFEYKYNFQLKAWKRINPKDIDVKTSVSSFQRGANFLNSIGNRLVNIRMALLELRRGAAAIKPDFDLTVGEILRETALMVKDAKMTTIFLTDVPPVILKGMAQTVVNGWANIKDSITSTDKEVIEAKAQVEILRNDLANGTSTTYSDAAPGRDLFANPLDSQKFFSSISLDSLNPPAQIRLQIIAERQRVRKFTRSDFEARRDKLIAFVADYADRVGVGHPSFSATYGRTQAAALRATVDDDYVFMNLMNDAIICLGKLAAYTDVNPANNFLNSLQALAGWANRSGIAMKVPVSKFAVPVPYGFTIEQISARYLKDPNRWEEIAALNGLRDPFIDEVGFDLPLLTNANGNTVTVSDITKLYVGQSVVVYSPTVGGAPRRITTISQVTTGYYAVGLDGLSLSANYTTNNNSVLHAWLPGTANSQQMIYIPSDRPSTVDTRTKSVPGVNDLDHLLNVGGIDMLLTPNGDLAITPDGDCRLAFGMSNIVQYATIAFSTPRGSLLQHPDFGLDVQPGQSVADLTAKEVLTAVKTMFAGDPTFTGVTSASVNRNGPVTSITVSLGVSGQDSVIPITVDVKR